MDPNEQKSPNSQSVFGSVFASVKNYFTPDKTKKSFPGTAQPIEPRDLNLSSLAGNFAALSLNDSIESNESFRTTVSIADDSFRSTVSTLDNQDVDTSKNLAGEDEEDQPYFENDETVVLDETVVGSVDLNSTPIGSPGRFLRADFNESIPVINITQSDLDFSVNKTDNEVGKSFMSQPTSPDSGLPSENQSDLDDSLAGAAENTFVSYSNSETIPLTAEHSCDMVVPSSSKQDEKQPLSSEEILAGLAIGDMVFPDVSGLTLSDDEQKVLELIISQISNEALSKFDEGGKNECETSTTYHMINDTQKGVFNEPPKVVWEDVDDEISVAIPEGAHCSDTDETPENSIAESSIDVKSSSESVLDETANFSNILEAVGISSCPTQPRVDTSKAIDAFMPSNVSSTDKEGFSESHLETEIEVNQLILKEPLNVQEASNVVNLKSNGDADFNSCEEIGENELLLKDGAEHCAIPFNLTSTGQIDCGYDSVEGGKNVSEHDTSVSKENKEIRLVSSIEFFTGPTDTNNENYSKVVEPTTSNNEPCSITYSNESLEEDVSSIKGDADQSGMTGGAPMDSTIPSGIIDDIKVTENAQSDKQNRSVMNKVVVADHASPDLAIDSRLLSTLAPTNTTEQHCTTIAALISQEGDEYGDDPKEASFNAEVDECNVASNGIPRNSVIDSVTVASTDERDDISKSTSSEKGNSCDDQLQANCSSTSAPFDKSGSSFSEIEEKGIESKISAVDSDEVLNQLTEHTDVDIATDGNDSEQSKKADCSVEKTDAILFEINGAKEVSSADDSEMVPVKTELIQEEKDKCEISFKRDATSCNTGAVDEDSLSKVSDVAIVYELVDSKDNSANHSLDNIADASNADENTSAHDESRNTCIKTEFDNASSVEQVMLPGTAEDSVTIGQNDQLESSVVINTSSEVVDQQIEQLRKENSALNVTVDLITENLLQPSSAFDEDELISAFNQGLGIVDDSSIVAPSTSFKEVVTECNIELTFENVTQESLPEIDQSCCALEDTPIESLSSNHETTPGFASSINGTTHLPEQPVELPLKPDDDVSSTTNVEIPETPLLDAASSVENTSVTEKEVSPNLVNEAVPKSETNPVEQTNKTIAVNEDVQCNLNTTNETSPYKVQLENEVENVKNIPETLLILRNSEAVVVDSNIHEDISSANQLPSDKTMVIDEVEPSICCKDRFVDIILTDESGLVELSGGIDSDSDKTRANTTESNTSMALVLESQSDTSVELTRNLDFSVMTVASNAEPLKIAHQTTHPSPLKKLNDVLPLETFFEEENPLETADTNPLLGLSALEDGTFSRYNVNPTPTEPSEFNASGPLISIDSSLPLLNESCFSGAVALDSSLPRSIKDLPLFDNASNILPKNTISEHSVDNIPDNEVSMDTKVSRTEIQMFETHSDVAPLDSGLAAESKSRPKDDVIESSSGNESMAIHINSNVFEGFNDEDHISRTEDEHKSKASLDDTFDVSNAATATKHNLASDLNSHVATFCTSEVTLPKEDCIQISSSEDLSECPPSELNETYVAVSEKSSLADEPVRDSNLCTTPFEECGIDITETHLLVSEDTLFKSPCLKVLSELNETYVAVKGSSDDSSIQTTPVSVFNEAVSVGTTPTDLMEKIFALAGNEPAASHDATHVLPEKGLEVTLNDCSPKLDGTYVASKIEATTAISSMNGTYIAGENSHCVISKDRSSTAGFNETYCQPSPPTVFNETYVATQDSATTVVKDYSPVLTQSSPATAMVNNTPALELNETYVQSVSPTVLNDTYVTNQNSATDVKETNDSAAGSSSASIAFEVENVPLDRLNAPYGKTPHTVDDDFIVSSNTTLINSEDNSVLAFANGSSVSETCLTNDLPTESFVAKTLLVAPNLRSSAAHPPDTKLSEMLDSCFQKDSSSTKNFHSIPIDNGGLNVETFIESLSFNKSSDHLQLFKRDQEIITFSNSEISPFKPSNLGNASNTSNEKKNAFKSMMEDARRIASSLKAEKDHLPKIDDVFDNSDFGNLTLVGREDVPQNSNKANLTSFAWDDCEVENNIQNSNQNTNQNKKNLLLSDARPCLGVLKEITGNVDESSKEMGTWWSKKESTIVKTENLTGKPTGKLFVVAKPDEFLTGFKPEDFDQFSTSFSEPDNMPRDSLYVKFDPCYAGRRNQDNTIFIEAMKNASEKLSKKSNSVIPATQINKTDKCAELQAEITRLRQLHLQKIKEEEDRNASLKEKMIEFDELFLVEEEKLKASLLRRERLSAKINNTNLINEKVKALVPEFQSTIAFSIEKAAMERAMLKDNIVTLTSEIKTSKLHLASAESAFIDVFSKYEKLRGNILESIPQKNNLEKEHAELRRLLLRTDDKMNDFQQKTNKEIAEVESLVADEKKQQSLEVMRLNAQLRKSEVTLSNMQDTLDTKIKENQKLASICDDLIAGRG